MSTSSTMIRIATLLFLLAGLLLLRKPIFGEAAAPLPAKPIIHTTPARLLELAKSSPREYSVHQIG